MRVDNASTATPAEAAGSRWPALVDSALRRLAAVTGAAAVSGLLVGAVASRLAMMLLAVMNPQATGVKSDDGFVMGQFTVSGTLNLVVVGTGIGVVGGGVYFVVRNLMIGPRWFQIASISAGAAVVVGSMLVHSEGVDFAVLKPTPLAVALFMLVPGLFAALLTVLAERWLRPDGWFMRARRVPAMAPLLLWIPLAPLFGLIAVGWLLVEQVRRIPLTAAAVGHPLAGWVARAALTAVFGASLLVLVREINRITLT
jgi:hypothetical protein